MAEIVLDDAKIAIPKKLKILSFLAEIQKKAPQQYIYVINEQDIGVFQSLSEVRKGMWRRYKLPDVYGHYYIDPETMNEIVIFSEEFANKLGAFPYEGPPVNKSSYTADITTTNRSMSTVNQMSIPSISNYTRSVATAAATVKADTPVQPVMNQAAFQASIASLQQSALQPPVVAVPLAPPPQQNNFFPYNNSIFQKTQQNQNQSQPSQYMSSKSIDNLNRILNFQSSNKSNNPYDPQNIYQNWNGNPLQNMFTSSYLQNNSQGGQIQGQVQGQQQGQVQGQQQMPSNQQQPVYQILPSMNNSYQNQPPQQLTQVVQPQQNAFYNNPAFQVQPLSQLSGQRIMQTVSQQPLQPMQPLQQQGLQQQGLQQQGLQQIQIPPMSQQIMVQPQQQGNQQQGLQQQGLQQPGLQQQGLQQQGLQQPVTANYQQSQPTNVSAQPREKQEGKVKYFPTYQKKKTTVASGAPNIGGPAPGPASGPARSPTPATITGSAQAFQGSIGGNEFQPPNIRASATGNQRTSNPRLQLQNPSMTNTAPQPVQSQFSA